MMFAGNCHEVPPADEWERRIRLVSNEELVKLWQHALGCLSQDVESQRWASHVGIAERIMERRGIKFR